MQQTPQLVSQTNPTVRPRGATGNARSQRPTIAPLLVQASTRSNTGQAGGGQPATHQLVVHAPPERKPLTSGPHTSGQEHHLEFIEPGIQNHKVEVYRSNGARQAIYKDTDPLDAGGFHLTVIGIRNSDYSH